jgi:hypothetical protein
MVMDPSAFVLYIVFDQLDNLVIEGRRRLLQSFSKIEEEAEEYGNRTLQSYMEAVGEGDPADFAEEAHDQAIRYWQVLDALRQTVLNLLAVGLYHLFEQHFQEVKRMLISRGRVEPTWRISTVGRRLTNSGLLRIR